MKWSWSEQCSQCWILCFYTSRPQRLMSKVSCWLKIVCSFISLVYFSRNMLHMRCTDVLVSYVDMLSSGDIVQTYLWETVPSLLFFLKVFTFDSHKKSTKRDKPEHQKTLDIRFRMFQIYQTCWSFPTTFRPCPLFFILRRISQYPSGSITLSELSGQHVGQHFMSFHSLHFVSQTYLLLLAFAY